MQKCVIKEKPILFNTDMVQAIIDGRKTQTRRIAKTDKPPYKAGDILYIRETWTQAPNGEYLYKAHPMYCGMDDMEYGKLFVDPAETWTWTLGRLPQSCVAIPVMAVRIFCIISMGLYGSEEKYSYPVDKE